MGGCHPSQVEPDCVYYGRQNHYHSFRDIDLISYYHSNENHNLRELYLDYLMKSKKLNIFKKYFILYEALDYCYYNHTQSENTILKRVLVDISIFLHEHSITKYTNNSIPVIKESSIQVLKLMKKERCVPIEKQKLLDITAELRLLLQESIISFQSSHFFLDFIVLKGNTVCKKRTLLVTKNILFSKIISKILYMSGYYTTHVTNDQDAIIELQCSLYDVVLVDDDLTGTDATSVYKEVLRLEKGMKSDIPMYVRPTFVAMLSEDDPEITSTAIDAGFSGVLGIPFKVPELESMLLKAGKRQSMSASVVAVSAKILKAITSSSKQK
jgi:CheY-like chemotaxis protein